MTIYSLHFTLATKSCVVIKKLDQPSVVSTLHSSNRNFHMVFDYPYPVSNGFRNTYLCLVTFKNNDTKLCLVSATERQGKQVDRCLEGRDYVRILPKHIRGCPDYIYNIVPTFINVRKPEYQDSDVEALIANASKYENFISKLYESGDISPSSDRQDLYYAIKYCRGIYEKANTDSAATQEC